MSDTPQTPPPPNPPKGPTTGLHVEARDKTPESALSGKPQKSPTKKKSSGLLSKIVLSFGGFVVLLLVVLLVAPSLVDWNSYKSEIQSQAKTIAGVDLSLTGDISLSLIPSPQLSVEDVSVANAPGASQPEIVSLKALEVRIALGPLIGGTIQVETIRLVDPVIEIEKLADGSTNVDAFIARAEAASASGTQDLPPRPGADSAVTPEDQAGGLVPGIQLDNFTILNGLVNYRDQTTGMVESIRDNFF